MGKIQELVRNDLAQLVYEAEHGPGPERVEEARQWRVRRYNVYQCSTGTIQGPNCPSASMGNGPEHDELEQIVFHGQQYFHTKDNGERIPFIIQSKSFGGLLSPFTRFSRSAEPSTSGKVIWDSQPYASRLWTRLISILPRYVYRTVHSDSAGEVVIHKDGTTEFLSEQRKRNGSPANFTDFDRKAHQADIRRHLRGLKTPTHLISFTDSLDYALYLCHRAYHQKKTRDVAMYVVDTHKITDPCVLMSMYCAVKAYAVRLKPVWVDKMFAYSSLTEYICWDSLRASAVEKIDYAYLMASGKDSSTVDPILRTSCAELFPALIAAAVFKDCRSGLHSKMYITPVEQLDIDKFQMNPWMHPKGERMEPPIAMAKISGPRMTDIQIRRIFNLVAPFQNRAVLFLGLLSMCATRFDPEHLPNLVATKYPQIVRSLLDSVIDEMAGGDCASALVYQAADPCCSRRIDVNACESFTERCVREWDRTAKHNDPDCRDLPVYIVRGEYRAARNLIRYEEILGSSDMLKMSRFMDEEAVLADPSNDRNYALDRENRRWGGLKLGTVNALSLAAVARYGTKIRHEETDEQIEARFRRDYPNQVFHGPETKNRIEPTNKRRKSSVFRQSSTIRNMPKASEERLLRIKNGGISKSTAALRVQVSRSRVYAQSAQHSQLSQDNMHLNMQE